MRFFFLKCINLPVYIFQLARDFVARSRRKLIRLATQRRSGSQISTPNQNGVKERSCNYGQRLQKFMKKYQRLH